MRTVKYENEPFDLKLMLLYMGRKIRYILYGIIIGVFAFVGGYYLFTNTFAPAPKYESKAELYLTYADDVRLDNVYINDYTWGTLVHTDKAMDYAIQNMDVALDRDFLEEAVTAGLVSDVRFVTLTVTTNDPNLSCDIAEAFTQSIIKFGTEMVDINEITVFTEPKRGKMVVKADRTLRMCITGAVIGCLASFVFLWINYLLDDSVIVPEDVKKRYGVTVVGMFTGKDRQKIMDKPEYYFGNDISDSTKKRMDWKRQYMKYYFRKQVGNCKKIALIDLGAKNQTEFCLSALQDLKRLLTEEEAYRIDHDEMKMEDAVFTSYDFTMDQVDGLYDDMTVVDRLHNYEGIIVMIRADERNGKMIEHSIDLLRNEGCNVIGAVVYDGDQLLWNQYYFSPFNSESKKLKIAEQEMK